MAATILEVAAAAGVAASTVSRTFSRPELISPETRDRVPTRLVIRQTTGPAPAR